MTGNTAFDANPFLGARIRAARSRSQPRPKIKAEHLLVDPHESLAVEIKGWLDLSNDEDKANLACAMIAIANSGGGHIILGFSENRGAWTPAGSRPNDLDRYTQDIINGIVTRYAEPPFHCDVRHATNPKDGLPYPVIVVPGDHRFEIHAKRDGPNQRHLKQYDVYIRKPGPRSEPPRTPQEWTDLRERCAKARSNFALRQHGGIAGIRKLHLMNTVVEACAVFDVRKIRYEIEEACFDWKRILPRVKRLRSFALEYGTQVRSEVVHAVRMATSEARLGIPKELARTASSVLAEALPIEGMKYHRVPRLTRDQQGLIDYVAEVAFELAYDSARYLRQLPILAAGSRVLWVILKFAHKNNKPELKDKIIEHYNELIKFCTEPHKPEFTDGKRWLEFEIRDATSNDGKLIPPDDLVRKIH